MQRKHSPETEFNKKSSKIRTRVGGRGDLSTQGNIGKARFKSNWAAHVLKVDLDMYLYFWVNSFVVGKFWMWGFTKYLKFKSCRVCKTMSETYTRLSVFDIKFVVGIWYRVVHTTCIWWEGWGERPFWERYFHFIRKWRLPFNWSKYAFFSLRGCVKLSPAARGSKEARFTQPHRDKLALHCSWACCFVNGWLRALFSCSTE